ncbi:hypothetical protein DAPPUDRAFT_318964 [Daphnia pulex]|uniref:Uncharacterized protein n=1 Tax=Daphnia pulex TaxID=6669 RepID=E9GK99_DAPPU|nr:hypothetical protein DAPPUDRAFT_318964 [Daphnia pulex]|eukprot:EFX80095.1 hypothetical protein DAPPUDRAFT_318964 [Daphnia pulex]
MPGAGLQDIHLYLNLPTHNVFKDVGYIVKFNGENYSDYRSEFLSKMEQLGMKTMVNAPEGRVEILPTEVRNEYIVTNQAAIDAWLFVTCRNYILATNEQESKEKPVLIF